MRKETIVLILALLGILLSAYAVSLHFSDDGSVCDISEMINCDKVNKSPWSELFGIPVAILGLLSYLTVFLLVLKRRTIRELLDFTAKDVWQYILLFVVIMTGFQIYLTMAEILWIHAYCLVCIASQILVLILLWLVYSLWKA